MSTAATTDSSSQHPPNQPTAPGGLDAFVSYSRRDKPFVIRLKEALERRGRNVWIDADDIPPGAQWRRELGTGIEAADAFVFVMSPDSVASPECGEELRRATELGKRLVPVLYREPDRVPDALATLQYVNAENGAAFERIVEQVDEAIETDHDWVREHTQWLARALRWADGGRDTSRLLRGAELDAAERWLARQAEGKKPPPTPLQTDYVVAGRHAERRRLRLVVAATLAALAVSIALGVLALVSRNEAIEQRDQARSRELTASAVAQLDVDPERSLLLALEAQDIARNATVEDALRRALMESHVRAEMPGHRASIADLSMSPDGRRLVTASRDHTARVFDTDSGRPLHVLRGHRAPVATAAFSPRADRLVTAGDDGTARIWDAVDGRQLALLRHEDGALHSAAFSPDGRRVVTAGADRTARVWDARTGGQVAILRAHRGEVLDAGFDPRGGTVLTAGEDGTSRLWKPGSGESSVLARHGTPLSVADFSANGRVAVTGEYAGTVRVWDPASGRRLSQLSGMALSAAVSPDGDTILTTTIDGLAAVWDSQTGARIAPLAGHGGPAFGAAVSPDGTLVATGGQDHTARVWDAEQGSLVAVLRGQREGVSRVAFTPDGASVVTGGRDGTVRRWDIGAGRVLRAHGGEEVEVKPPVNSAVPTRDGRLVVTAAEDGTVRLWNAWTGSEIVHRRGCGLPPRSAFSCLGLATATGHLVSVAAADPSPDGTRVASAGNGGTAFVSETVSGRRVATLQGHGGRVHRIAFGPGGQRLVTAGSDGTARVWDARSGDELARLRGHRGDVNAATFMPGGRRVATAGGDGTVRIWRAGGGRPERTFRIDEDSVLDVAASPDGRHLAAPVGDTARVWDVETALALNHRPADAAVLGGLLGLCALVGRALLRDLRAHPANFPEPVTREPSSRQP
jgi:WD40 repeat protein